MFLLFFLESKKFLLVSFRHGKSKIPKMTKGKFPIFVPVFAPKKRTSKKILVPRWIGSPTSQSGGGMDATG
jgi:hypothetical protein